MSSLQLLDIPLVTWLCLFPPVKNGCCIGILCPLTGLLLKDKVVAQVRRGETVTAGERPGLGGSFYLLFLASLTASVASFVFMMGRSLAMNDLGLAAAAISSAAAISGAATLPLPPLVGWLSDRVGRKRFLALGWLAAQLMARADDRLIVSTLTTLLAYGSYLVAEHFHVSGVLAVVMAGLVSGNVGLAGASPTTKIMLFNLWDYLGFLANSLVFLLIGLDVDLERLWADLIPIAIAVTAVLLSRGLVVYGMPLIARVLRRRPLLPLDWRHVLFWGGLRGAISLALVLGVPDALLERDMLESMTFGVMLFTLLVQGTTVQFLLDRLGLTQQPPHRVAREKRLGQFFAAQAGLRRLEHLRREGLLLDEMWNGLRADYLRAQKHVTERMIQLFHDHAELEREMLLQARLEALQAERGALGDALRRGFLSEHVYTELVTDIDYRLEALDLIQVAIVGVEAH